jgi:hypothetical protein
MKALLIAQQEMAETGWPGSQWKSLIPQIGQRTDSRGYSPAGFDLLADDELDAVDDRVENERVAAANANLFRSESEKVIYLTRKAELAKAKAT